MGIINYIDIRILEIAAYTGDVTKREIMEDFNMVRSTVLTAIKRLKDAKFLERIGFDKKIRYLITKEGWDYLQSFGK